MLELVLVIFQPSGPVCEFIGIETLLQRKNSQLTSMLDVLSEHEVTSRYEIKNIKIQGCVNTSMGLI